MRNIHVWLIGVGLALQLFGCSEPLPVRSTDILRIGLLPDESEKTLRARHLPLFEFLSQQTGLSYELIVPNSYGELVKKFGQGQIDLAYFGGVTFVKANSEYNAVPLVMRDVDSRFTSVIVVADEGINDFRELQGRRFSFGSRLSTSGHLMPRHFLQVEHGVTPEEYFGRIQYSGKHDQTAYRVRDGEVDGGAINSEILRKMFTDGRLQLGEIRAIWKSPPYPDYVWAVHPKMHPVDREAIQQAFLRLSVDNPQQEAVLSNLGTAGFYPASIDDFSVLKQIMAEMGVL